PKRRAAAVPAGPPPHIGDSLRAVSSALEGMRGALGEELALLQSRLLAPGRRLLELGWLLDGFSWDSLQLGCLAAAHGWPRSLMRDLFYVTSHSAPNKSFVEVDSADYKDVKRMARGKLLLARWLPTVLCDVASFLQVPMRSLARSWYRPIVPSMFTAHYVLSHLLGALLVLVPAVTLLAYFLVLLAVLTLLPVLGMALAMQVFWFGGNFNHVWCSFGFSVPCCYLGYWDSFGYSFEIDGSVEVCGCSAVCTLGFSGSYAVEFRSGFGRGEFGGSFNILCCSFGRCGSFGCEFCCDFGLGEFGGNFYFPWCSLRFGWGS
ncbi:unnamed protein product, partial [Prorocentrum cordatum]